MQILRALKLGLWLTRWLPFPVQRSLYYPLGVLFYLSRPATRRVIIANQRQVLATRSRLHLQWQACCVLVNVVRNYHALLRLHQLADDELADDRIHALVEMHGWERLEAALAGGRGAIVLGAHMANYNILAPFSSLFGLPVAAFVEPVRPPALFEFMSKIRARTGLQLLLPNREGTAAALRLLRAGGILIVTGDRYLGTNGTLVKFFGRPTLLPHGMVVLALRHGVPVLPVTLRRLPRGRVLVEFRTPLPLIDTGRTREDRAVNMRLVAQALEETIGSAPEQWIVLDPVWPAEPPATQRVGHGAKSRRELFPARGRHSL